jgi:hypothetical protein
VNFNLYLDRASAARLDRVARQTRRPRNALVREAVRVWLDRSGAAWPEEVLKFESDPSLTPFESHRAEFGSASDDPFAPAPRQRRGRRRAC